MKKIRAILAALMMVAALPVIPAIPAQAVNAPDPLDGTYVIRNVNSGKVLNVEGGKAENGTNVQQWSTDAAHTYDTWRIVSAGDGLYKIYSLLGDGKTFVLNAGADSNVSIGTDAGTDGQLYSFIANKDGSFRIVSKADEKAVEIVNALTDSGANVQVWEQNGVNCQDWELIPVTWTTEGEETKCVVTGDTFLPGDLNDDGVVDIFDVALAKHIALNNAGTQHQKYAANVDGKEGVGVTDVVSIAKWVLTGKGEFIPENVPSERLYAAVDGSVYNGDPETTNTGFTQSAYLNLYNEVGSSVTLNVNAPAAGIYALTVNYANGGAAARSVSVLTNRQTGYYTLEGQPTEAWTNWEKETIYVSLQAGMNTVVFTSLTADGAPNLDSITIANTDQPESSKTPIDPVRGIPAGGQNNNAGEGYQVEYLTRGLVAANTGSGMLLTWRILATDDSNTSYKLYKNGTLLKEIAAGSATNYLDAGGTAADKYTIDTYSGSTCIDKGSPATVFGTKNSGQSGAYFDINTQKPADQTMPDGSTCSYTENDCSVGDIDGDGVYEIFVKWDPSNSQDNSKTGYTGTTFFDCYRLDGTLVWRIDLGVNIRSGAHYTQFLVYDFDGDGKCELICKTADGTKDGKGNYIGDKSKDWRNSSGTVLDGPEYITLFDGMTGAALDTQDYDPARGAQGKETWGDTYGNRSERYTACVAYLDGQNASACFGRGYYTRLAVAAWDVRGGKLSKRWVFDTGFNVNAGGYGDGNHHELAADVDGDGKQEVVCGSAVIDDNGKLLYTTYNAHGDAIHIGDFDPSSPGLEIFQCLEDENHPNGKAINFGVQLRRASDGFELFRETAGGDTGRAICDNLIAGNAGAEMNGSHSGNVYLASGSHEVVCQWSDITKWGQNSLVYWTDVLERAVLDRTMADQYGKGRVFTGDGVTYNNASKSNACLSCDLMGDWREELIYRKSDGGLRVFTTTFQTEYPIYTLMHNAQYRVQVAAQNNGYNQPPHTDYFLGTGYPLPTAPTVFDYTVK
ncbi:MAG: RICIN domain-containing protein [Oscillospiraceae bacterium]|nr:RICIN domain-containing protein [Oscillospiraceae bacterium]